MRKAAVLAITSMIILGVAANALAADLLGYPIVEKQMRFYSIIFGVMGISIILVALSYVSFRVTEVKKTAPKRSGAKAFGSFASASQPAK